MFPSSWFLFSILHGDLSSRGVNIHWLGILGCGFLWLHGQGSLWEGHTTEDGFIREGDITFHLLPQLQYTPHQKEWLSLGRQIGFLHLKLEGLGIGNHLLQLQLPNIPTGELWVRLSEEALPVDAWQCQWGLIVIFHTMLLTNLLGKFEGGPHLLG